MKSKKLISLILSAAMVVSCLPVWAEGELLQQPEGMIESQENREAREQMAKLLEELVPQQNAAAEPQALDADIDMELAAQEAREAVNVSEGALKPAAGGYWHESMEQYQEFDYSDPNWISDKSFFGEWDGTKWVKRPQIDYSYGGSKLLAGAEEAVKDGDYELAKEFVCEYYKNKFRNQPRVLQESADRRVDLQSVLQFDNMFFNQATGFMPQDIVSVPKEDNWVSANVVEIAQSAASSVNKEHCFIAVALKKDGYQAVFHSMDTENENVRPYVEATVNGVKKTFYPTQDVMISAGSNKKENYQGQPTISVQEAAIGEAQPVNSDTKRMYIKIDFTGLVAGDDITEARLYLYGHNTKPEGNKDVVLFYTNAAVWDEATVNWDGLEHLIFSFDGESGPKWEQPSGAGYRFEEEMNRFENYARAIRMRYRYTKNEAYAYHGLRTWLDYYRKKGNLEGYRKNLDVGVRAKELPLDLAYYADSEFMTQEVFTPLLKFAWQMGGELIRLWNTQSLTTNWGSYETGGLSNLAINFPEFYDAAAPLQDGATPEIGGRGGWIEVAGYRYVAMAGETSFEDGSCSECSVEYTVEIIEKAMDMKGLADEAGWTDFQLPSALGELLIGLAHYVLNATGPNFVDFQQGNAASYHDSFIPRLLGLNNAVSDPFLRWAVSGGKDGKAPEYTSILYPVGVKAILRSGWSADDTYIQTNADGGVKNHGHHDDMALNMFAYGQYLLVDPKYMNYDKDNPHRAWLNSNRAHNTVEINDVSARANTWNFSNEVTGPSGETLRFPKQNSGKRGSIVDSELNGGYDYLYLNSPNYKDLSIGDVKYADVDYDRSILFIRPGYAIVTDYLKPQSEQDTKVNKYSQGWHFLPDANPTLDAQTGIVQTNFAGGANIQVIPVWQDDGMEKNLLDGWFSYGTGNATPAKYATYVKNQAGDTTFSTLLLPMKAGQKLESAAQNIPLDIAQNAANAFRLTFDDDATSTKTEGTYYILLDKAQQKQRAVGDYATDGILTYVEQENGYYTRVILRGGTNAVNEKNGQKLLRSKTALQDISVKYTANNIEINSSKTIPLEGLQLYSGGKKIAGVKLNGENVSFQQDGATGDIYFAETMPFDGNSGKDPSVTPTPTPTPTPSNPPRVTPNGSGSSGGGGSSSVKTGGGLVQVVGEATPPSTTEPSGIPKPADPYEQQLSGHWAKTEIGEMLKEGVVQGTATGDLELQNQTTRAEFVTMLVRALGMEMQKYDGEFADVSADDWYADYMATAKKEGILEGNGAGANPNGLITREEMAKILVETYEKEHGEITVSPDTGAWIQDAAEGSDWARTYIQKAIGAELMNGVGGGMFAPQENALREQAIVVIYRMKTEKK